MDIINETKIKLITKLNLNENDHLEIKVNGTTITNGDYTVPAGKHAELSIYVNGKEIPNA